MNRSIFNVFQSNKFSLVKLVLPVWYISLLTQCVNRENELVDFSLHWRRKEALSIYIFFFSRKLRIKGDTFQKGFP